MFTSIEDLAHDLQQVVSWHPDNQPCREHHITQIAQAAINMPGSTDGMKGCAVWIPHRTGQLEQFRTEVLRRIGCNLDTTFNHCHTTMVFLLHEGSADRKEWDMANYRDRHRWWQGCVARQHQHNYAWGLQVPLWLLPQIASLMMYVSGCGMEARRLGYEVQFISLAHVIEHQYRHFPDLLGRPYIPAFAVNIGTRALRKKMSDRRNRLWKTVTDDQGIIRPDQITRDHDPHFAYDDTLMTPLMHEALRHTYQDLLAEPRKK